MVTTSGTSGADQESGMASEESAQQKLPRKRTMWTNEEDMLLLRGVRRNGEGNWAAILRFELHSAPLRSTHHSTQRAARGVGPATSQQHPARTALECNQA